MSAMQKMVLEQDAKRHVPVVSTHFYHVDPKEGTAIQCSKYHVFHLKFIPTELYSTTRRDFIRPEEVC